MADYFTRLAVRLGGSTQKVRPLIPSRFEQVGPTTAGGHDLSQELHAEDQAFHRETEPVVAQSPLGHRGPESSNDEAEPLDSREPSVANDERRSRLALDPLSDIVATPNRKNRQLDSIEARQSPVSPIGHPLENETRQTLAPARAAVAGQTHEDTVSKKFESTRSGESIEEISTESDRATDSVIRHHAQQTSGANTGNAIESPPPNPDSHRNQDRPSDWLSRRQTATDLNRSQDENRPTPLLPPTSTNSQQHPDEARASSETSPVKSIEISIGRVEITAALPPPAPNTQRPVSRPATSQLSLQAYLEERNLGSRS